MNIFKENNREFLLTCNPSNAVCLALIIYCFMNEYEKTNGHETILDNEINLTQILNENKIETIFKEIAFEILKKLSLKSLGLEIETYNQSIIDLIDNLTKDLEHWKVPKNQPSVYFYINTWLKGKQPPPRCKAFINELLCFQEADENSPYCKLLHNCKSFSCKNQRIIGNLFCENHCCQIQNCKNERFKETKFCSKHICSACILTNSKEIKSRDPFACNEHKCMVNDCDKLQIYPYHGYCIEHVCEECAITIKADKHFPKLNETELCVKHKCCLADCKLKRINSTIEFCACHICRLCSTNNVLIGADKTCPESQLCYKHRCSSNNCLKSKINSSSYCVNHSCKECIALKCSTINPAADEKPRNSCKIHPLCQFVSNKGNYFIYE